MSKSVSAVDLFCGAGGLTCGLKQAGIPVNVGIDFDVTCKYPFEINNKSRFIHRNVEKVTISQLKHYYPKGDIKVLVGCAPCQPFSKHTRKNKNRKDDGKWQLLTYFQRLVEELKPEIISIENVPEIRNEKIFIDFVDKLKSLDYHVNWKIVYCPDYNIPQNRNRLVLLASLLGEITLIPPTKNQDNYSSVKTVIGKLKPIRAGEVCLIDPLHRSSSLTEKNLQRIRQSRPGGTWVDWDNELRLQCHTKKTGESYKAVYGRMKWDIPSPTITTQFFNYGTGRFGHPEQDRALSLREGALLQTFPQNYKFIDPDLKFSFDRIGRYIGNAVPVRLGYVIGQSINHHLENLNIH